MKLLNKVFSKWKPFFEYENNPWKYYCNFLERCLQNEYKFITFSDVLNENYSRNEINIILDHHIDFYPIETHVMTFYENQLGIVSSIYLFNKFPGPLNLQKKKWNIEDLDIKHYQTLEDNGFEIGYHQNAISQLLYYKEKNFDKQKKLELIFGDKNLIKTAVKIAIDDVNTLRKYFNIRTMIPHGGGDKNNFLKELVSIEKMPVWVYNKVPKKINNLKWNNFSDSTSIYHNWINIKNIGSLACSRDPLMMNLMCFRKGLNHVLIHPGRFSKGMDYGNLNNKEIVEKKNYHFSWDLSEFSNFYKNDHKKCKYLFTNNKKLLFKFFKKKNSIIPTYIVNKFNLRSIRSSFKVPRPIPNDHMNLSKNINRIITEENFLDYFHKAVNFLYTTKILLFYSNKMKISSHMYLLLDVEIFFLLLNLNIIKKIKLKKKPNQAVRLILKKNIINVVFLKIFSKVLNLKFRLKKDRIEISL